MTDIRTALREASAHLAVDDTTEAVAEADLLRARRALRRRRLSRASFGSGVVAAAALGALAVVGPGGTTAPSGGSTNASAGPSTAHVTFVSYTGTKPVGYTLDEIPSGWTIRDDTRDLLTLVPDGSKAPVEGPGETSLEGAVAVMTESDTGVPTGVQLDDVSVDGKAAVIAHMKGSGGARSLFLRQPSGDYLVIQVWGGLGWDDQDIATFASSVHVTSDARHAAG